MKKHFLTFMLCCISSFACGMQAAPSNSIPLSPEAYERLKRVIQSRVDRDTTRRWLGEVDRISITRDSVHSHAVWGNYYDVHYAVVSPNFTCRSTQHGNQIETVFTEGKTIESYVWLTFAANLVRLGVELPQASAT